MDKQHPESLPSTTGRDARRAPARAQPSLAAAVARLYASASPHLRVDLLRALLRPVGPLALAGIAAGAFASLLPSTRWQGARVTIDSITGIGAEAVVELVHYLEQKSPELLANLPELLDRQSGWMATASGALLMLALRAWMGESRQR